MTALPTTTEAFASGATEAQFKTFLSNQRAYLAGLLGTDGTTETAKSTLGMIAGVTSLNGNTGAVTAGQVSDAATIGYGYIPLSQNMTHGAVGSLCWAYVSVTAGVSITAGSTKAGSALTPASMFHNNTAIAIKGSGTLSGTWKLLGHIASHSTDTVLGASLWQRII